MYLFAFFVATIMQKEICSNKGGDFLLALALVDVMKYLISGLFAFYTFNNSKNFAFAKIFVPMIIYTVSVTVLNIFISPAIAVVSTMVIFVCLLLTSKVKIHSYIFTYSLFINCLLEYINFLMFEIVSLGRMALGLPEFTIAQPTRLAVGRAILVLLYSFAIFCVYKFSLINTKTLCGLSKYKGFSIFLIIALGLIMYLKYHIRYTHSNDFHYILSVVFVFFIVLSLAFIFVSETFLETIENFQKKKINPAIEEAKPQRDKGYAGLIFESKESNSQVKFFQHELYIIGIDIEDKKVKQLEFI